MTQEEKLLFVDLSARLPYEVYAETVNELGETNINRISPDNIKLVSSGWFKECKPYLRPMSSMTEEELREYEELCFIYDTSDGSVLFGKNGLDWLNAHHFDYRGLIPMGLAFEAPKGMYNL